MYGSEINTRSISINRYFITAIKEVGRNSIFPLKIDGKVKNVILRDYQNEFISNEILHVDLLQVDNDTEIDTKISVVLTGTSIEEKSGGFVHQFLYELDITAKAKDLPDEIRIDITDFEIGRSVRVEDIKREYINCLFKHEDEETIAIVGYVKERTSEEEETETEAIGV
ncbi:50S ribosomal protein L25 [Evansella clarkii]|uniref:50S ribosomal protein L25 n=1 Tax=Evansella clarkii TaxID=79879 RepID=UPI001EEECD95|nr:50S ribosomal protein L25 [Evansella clarkii]